uniref:Tumor protein p53-inducible protein 13 n=2 Tax=Cyclopterus lumpus TaxID=8103 RepID=A0A8C3G6H9_CYCLU
MDTTDHLWPSVDTVYDPVPARQICMDKSISYNHTIPNSGAYRPVRAESGEYLYCPPQRWLNNLHHGATVLLYHPCAPLRERLLLSVLARSCLPDYIVTSHPRLSEHTPVAFVSWGHTLEMSTAASSDVYGWLETTTSTRRKKVVGVNPSRKYNLLLTRSAEQRWQQDAHPEERSAKMKESLRQCFERTISSQLTGAMETEPESNVKRESLKLTKEKGKRRWIRAAVKEIREDGEEGNKRADTITHLNNRTTTISRTRDIQNYNFTLGPSTDSPLGSRTLLDTPEAPSQSNQDLTPRSTTPLGTNMSRTTLTSDPQISRLTPQTAARQPSPKRTGIVNPLADGVNGEHRQTAGPEDEDEGNDSVEQRDDKDFAKHSLKDKDDNKDNAAGGSRRDNEVVDVKERELEHKQTHSDTHPRHESETVSKTQSETRPEPQRHRNPQSSSHLSNSPDCDGCKAGGGCECDEDSGASDAVNKGLPRTPRTDEAVWAAAALGFLLILLTLSVLHTRLYRHWRTTPSLYWRHPEQDYDSVADVIRRRLRIANKRRKRGRRRECVLLPSSSSSDELP